LTTLEAGKKTSVASHPAEEIYYILEGTGKMRLGNAEEPVRPDTVIIITSNTPHQISATNAQLRFLWIAASPTH
jgi:mannose-6-phosphate isomerase-like protein (cupin superfamily)